MKVAKAIDLYLEYHRLNSQKKYEPHLWVPVQGYRPIVTLLLEKGVDIQAKDDKKA